MGVEIKLKAGISMQFITETQMRKMVNVTPVILNFAFSAPLQEKVYSYNANYIESTAE